ncbi:MAG: ammonia channel protein, partial [Dehalococcoidia bacterium]
AAGVVCYLALQVKFRFNFDDSLDVVAVHLVGGILGALLLGVLAQESIGGIGGSFEQLGRQALSVVVAFGYSFVLSYGIALGLHLLIGIRVDEEHERRGLDLTLHDEQSYVLAE